MKKLFLIAIGSMLNFQQAFALEFTLIPDNDPELTKAFETGDFTTDLIIKYGLYLVQVLIEIAGVVAVILVMIGGYRYVIGSFSEAKEGGKNTITYALIGFAICVLSWIIVDLIIAFLTTE